MLSTAVKKFKICIPRCRNRSINLGNLFKPRGLASPLSDYPGVLENVDPHSANQGVMRSVPKPQETGDQVSFGFLGGATFEDVSLFDPIPIPLQGVYL